ncbi:MAG: NADH-quinone oxidoreductase subunit A [Planctomycetota bacterium]|jgi:NADH-quinone oxidoreductase subunit A
MNTMLIIADAEGYLPILILLAVGASFGLINLALTTFLGPRNDGEVKQMTYETGMNPVHTARRRFNVRFYILAMIFLIFDVEIVFLYPWATVFPNLDMGEGLSLQFLLRMVFFILTSVIAFLYAWRKGVFKFD